MFVDVKLYKILSDRFKTFSVEVQNIFRVGNLTHKLKLLFAHQGFRRYFKNTSWLFGEKILRMLAGLFVVVWVTRYLGPEQFGLFSYAQSFVSLFTVIATLGLDGVVVRELVRDDNPMDALIGTSFFLKLIGAVAVFIILIFAIKLTSNDALTNALIFIIASAMIFQSFNVIDFYFQSEVLSRYAVYANAIALFLGSCLKIVLIIYQAPLVAFAWAVLFDSVVLALGLVHFFLRRKQCMMSWVFDKRIAKQLLKDSSPLMIAGVINSIYMKIDQVMIKELLDAAQVGFYAAAVKLSEAWFAIGVVICKSLFPAIIHAKEVSVAFYHQRLQKLFSFLVVLAYGLSALVFFFSDRIVSVLYGEAFAASAPVLTVHIFSAIFVYLGVVSGRWLINENKSQLSLYRNTVGVVLNIVLNYFWIRQYGILGAAYASLLTYIVAFYLFDLLRSDTRKIFTLKTKALLLIGVRE